MMKNTSIEYYDVWKDLADYPDAWLICAYSARSVGKTYGFLRGAIERGYEFLYMKRQIKDLNIITNIYSDLSPFKPIVRDTGWNITFQQIEDGIVQVLKDDEEIGFCGAIAAIHKYKGMGFDSIKYIVLDEFLPQWSERVSRKEGESLLDLYMTASRDRELRGEDHIRLLLFANATQLYCPITETVGLVDELADLNMTGEEYLYLEDREILVHHCPELEGMEDMAIFRGMKGTKWADMAFGGKFAFNDFSKVKKVPLKGMVCHLRIRYNNQDFYIYQHKDNGLYYMCKSRGGYVDEFDMDIEADRRRFWLDYGIGLRQEITDGNMFFSSYSAYNLIFNFTKLYKL